MENKELKTENAAPVQEFSVSAMKVSEAVDLKPLQGKTAKIGEIKIDTVPSQYHKPEGYRYVLKVFTEQIDDMLIGRNKVPLRAMEMFNIWIEDGTPRWSDRSELNDFLESHGVINPDDLMGKEVSLNIRVSQKEGQKYGREFLGFN